MKHLILTTFLFMGIIDLIEEDIAFVVVDNPGEEQQEYLIPVKLIPCQINEGDMIYALIEGGVTEIRCGEPPD